MSGLILVKNRKATFEYEILQKYEAGVVLTGGEVKSLRKGSASFAGSFVQLLSSEAYLLNVQISPYTFADNRDYDPKRTRKLLLHKRELADLQQLTAEKGRTLIPLAFVLKHNQIKLEFGLARGKKLHDKRRELKAKAQQRDMERELKRR